MRRFLWLLSLVLVLAFPVSCWPATLPVNAPTIVSQSTQGFTIGESGCATLAQAVTTIGSTPATLHYSKPETLSSNLTIPATLVLAPERGAILSISTGATLTINGSFQAGLYQCFSCTPGQVIFGQPNNVIGGPMGDFYPEWFGAMGDGVTDDLNALNCCLTAMVGNPPYSPIGRGIMHLTEWYAVSSTFSVDDISAGTSTIIQGTGRYASGIIALASCDAKPAVEVVGTADAQLLDFGIVGINNNIYGTAPTVAPSVALLISRSVNNSANGNSRFSNLGIRGFFRFGSIYVYGYSDSVFDGITANCSPINSNQWMFDILFASSSCTRPFQGIVATNSTLSTASGYGAENNEVHHCYLNSVPNTAYKAAGNAWLYCVGESYPFVKNSGGDGQSNYLAYALDGGVIMENSGLDGGGTIAGIYLVSNSQAGGWPSACQQSVYLTGVTNNGASNLPALLTDSNTLLVNSVVNGLRGPGSFQIQLGKGAKGCKFIDVDSMTSFVVSAGTFNHCYLEVPWTCATLTLPAYSDTVVRNANTGFTISELYLGSTQETFPASGLIAGTTDTQTLTNKTLTPRVYNAPSATSISLDSDNYDAFYQANTQGSGTLTINNFTGTPTAFQKVEGIISAVNSQTFSWGNAFVGSTDFALPTTIGAGKELGFVFIYGPVQSKWILTALTNIQ